MNSLFIPSERVFMHVTKKSLLWMLVLSFTTIIKSEESKAPQRGFKNYLTTATTFTAGIGMLTVAGWRLWPLFAAKHNPAPDSYPTFSNTEDHIVLIFAHGFGDNKQTAHALNQHLKTNTIIGFNFKDYAVGGGIPWTSLRFTNLGQESDTLTLLTEIVRIYLHDHIDLQGTIIEGAYLPKIDLHLPLKKERSLKIGLIAPSRGGAAAIGALAALTFPEEHKNIWDAIAKEFNIPTASLTPLINNVRAAVEAGPIFLAQPLLNTKKVPFFTQFGRLQSLTELAIALASNYNPFAEQPITKLQKIATQNSTHFNITITLATNDEVVGTAEQDAIYHMADSPHPGFSSFTILRHDGGHNNLSIIAQRIKLFLEQQKAPATTQSAQSIVATA